MNSEIIASKKSVLAKGKDMVIVTTVSGAQIWVPKAQDDSAETVSYQPRKAGEKYVTKAGVEGVLLQDRNDFKGFGKSTKSDNAIKVYTALAALGIVPALAL